MSLSQETISFSGYFRENFRWIKLDEKTTNTLFIMEKGSVFLPEWGCFLELSPTDAQRLQQKTVLIIPFFDKKICFTYNRLFTIEATLVPTTEDTYIAKKIYRNHKVVAQYPDDLNKRFPSAYQLMQQGNPIPYNRLSIYEDLRDIPLWIDQLNNKDSISFIGEINWHGVNRNGRTIGGTDYYQEKMAVADIAQKILDKLYRFRHDFPLPKNPTAEAYKIWLKNILNTDITEKICPSKIRSFRIRKDGYGHSLRKNNNLQQRNVMLLSSPSEGKQLIDLEPITFSEKNIPMEATFVEAFYLNNQELYVLNDYNDIVWEKYSLKEQDNHFSYQKEKEIVLLKHKKKNPIQHFEAFFTENFLYLYYEEDKIYKALCIDTQTGQVLKETNLSDLLPKDDAIHYIRIGHIGETQISFLPIVISGKKRKYHVNLTENGASSLIDLGEKYPNWGGYFDGNPPYYIKNVEDTLYKYSISEKWQSEALFSDKFLSSPFAVADEEYINVIYNTTDAFFEKVLFQRLDKQTLKKVGEPLCLYSYLIVERRSSENTPVNFWAFKAYEKWNVTFEIGNFFYWVQVQ